MQDELIMEFPSHRIFFLRHEIHARKSLGVCFFHVRNSAAWGPIELIWLMAATPGFIEIEFIEFDGDMAVVVVVVVINVDDGVLGSEVNGVRMGVMFCG